MQQRGPFTASHCGSTALIVSAAAAAVLADEALVGRGRRALTCFTMVLAKTHPGLLCTSLSPGFIQTNMTKGD